jgi:hypothetical protein
MNGRRDNFSYLAGFVCASVVAVSSPLDAALPRLATAANTPLNSAASASASEPNSTTAAAANATFAGAAGTGAGAAAGEMRLKPDLAARSVVLRVESCVWSTYDSAPAPQTSVLRAGSGEYVNVPEPGPGLSVTSERGVDVARSAAGRANADTSKQPENAEEGGEETGHGNALAAANPRVVGFQAALQQVAQVNKWMRS